MKKEKCSRCGYDKHKEALDVHHVFNEKGIPTKKIVILCANCHREEHWIHNRVVCDKCNKVTRKDGIHDRYGIKLCARCANKLDDYLFWAREKKFIRTGIFESEIDDQALTNEWFELKLNSTQNMNYLRKVVSLRSNKK